MCETKSIQLSQSFQERMQTALNGYSYLKHTGFPKLAFRLCVLIPLPCPEIRHVFETRILFPTASFQNNRASPLHSLRLTPPTASPLMRSPLPSVAFSRVRYQCTCKLSSPTAKWGRQRVGAALNQVHGD